VVPMGLDKVIERIEKEGDEKVKSIIRDAENQVEDIIKKAKKTIDEMYVRKKQELEKQLETFKTQEQSSIEIEAKKIRLNAQKEILDTVYQDCLDGLQSLPHEKILSSLLKKVKEEMPEAMYIYSNKRDEPLVRLLSKLTYEDNIDCVGGIVLENKERTMKLDYRYETIAMMIWDLYLGEIADKLFR
jgi:V/A-type H+-transporting ATPase subunit E